MLKRFPEVLAWFVLSWTAAAYGESVPVRMVGMSLHIAPATTRQPLTRLEQTLSFSRVPDENRINNEMGLSTDDHGFTHDGFFLLTDPVLFETHAIAFILDIPAPTDGNTNGIVDFFDLQAEVINEKTQGFHDDGSDGVSEISATWNRAAGTNVGTVKIELLDLGLTFTHEMTLLTFAGSYDYTRAGTNLTGAVRMTNLLDSSEVVQGLLEVRVISTNQLAYSAGAWTNTAGFSYTYQPLDTFLAEESFVAILGFQDGFPATTDADYNPYLLILQSTDADQNGVLDLVQTSMETNAVQLRIQRATEGIRLDAFGSAGENYILESSSELGGQWQTVQVLTTTVTLPANGAKRYFRLRRQ
jgi:hypothetical protein